MHKFVCLVKANSLDNSLIRNKKGSSLPKRGFQTK